MAKVTEQWSCPHCQALIPGNQHGLKTLTLHTIPLTIVTCPKMIGWELVWPGWPSA